MKKNLLFGFLMLVGVSSFAQTIGNAFFDKVNYRGAFDANDWTSGWANFNPETTVYPTPEVTLTGNITSSQTLGSPLYGAASFTDTAVADSFFTKVDYVGAFGKTDWTSGWANFNPQTTVYPATTTTISGNITTSTTWTKSSVYLLTGFVRVQSGATLTIEPGTVIRGDKATTGALIIEPGAKLIANGTAANPIVFTSNQDPGSRTYGDWGGVVLVGNAPVNQTSPVVEGGIGNTYGGSDATDNSGSLQYVRIEFPGVALTTTANSEINGLTFCGVGSGTTIDYVQVSYSGDDSYEWFGGTVNCKHLIAFRGLDDDFDTDYGFSGMVQFGVSLRDPDEADSSKSNSFESDNDGSGSTNTPFTSAVFSNISSFGPLATASTTIDTYFQAAMHIRRSSKLKVYNSVFAGWPKGIIIDGTNSQASADAGDLVVKNTILAGCTTNFAPASPTTWAEETWFNTAGFSNTTYTNNSDLGVNDPFSLDAPDFTLTSASPLLAGSYWDASSGIISSSSGNNALTVYPNPAVSEVNVVLPTYDGVSTIQIQDLTGKTLLNKAAKNSESETVDVTSLNQGVYLISVRQGNTLYNQRLIVK
jgi:hypothetical protein